MWCELHRQRYELVTAQYVLDEANTGTDESGGSGIAAYDVFVSDTDGPFTKWQDHTALTSASFTGQVDHI